MSFLPGSLVTMGDGSKKEIEKLKIGDVVADGYGNNVLVRGLRNLYSTAPYNSGLRPAKINNEIVCIKDQIFMGADGYFYMLEGENNNIFYNHSIIRFIVSKNNITVTHNYDLKNRTKLLQTGSIIMKDSGPVEVNSIEFLDPLVPKDITWDEYEYKNETVDGSWSSELEPIGTDVLRHKIDGRGTYIVNGYVCLSTQSKYWDYENNVMLSPEKVQFVQYTDSNVVERIINK